LRAVLSFRALLLSLRMGLFPSSLMLDDGPDVDVHGGLTYSGRCSGHICHVAQPGEPDDVWWFGFDCGHFLDVLPAMDARSRQYGLGTTRGTYKTLDYVQAETNQLAEQLARTES